MYARSETGLLQRYGCYFRSLMIGIGISESCVPGIYQQAVQQGALPVDCTVDPSKLVPFLNRVVLPKHVPGYELRFLGFTREQRVDCICIACYRRSPDDQHFILLNPVVYDTLNGHSKIVSETKVPHSYRCYALVKKG